MKHKNKRGPPVPQLPRSTRPQQGAEDQAQIERTNVDQQSLESVYRVLIVCLERVRK